MRFTVFHHITLLLFGLLVGVLYIHPYTFTQPPQHFAWCQCVNVKCNKRQARHRHLNGCFVLITSFHVFCRHLIILVFFPSSCLVCEWHRRQLRHTQTAFSYPHTISSIRKLNDARFSVKSVGCVRMSNILCANTAVYYISKCCARACMLV